MSGVAIALVGAALFSAACVLPPRGQATPTCLGASGETSFLQSGLVGTVTGTDPTSVTVRQALQLPQLAATAVTVVTDSRTCANAASALDAVQRAAFAGRRMHVFKLGNTRYAVYEAVPPRSMADTVTLSRRVMWYFDSKWKFVSAGVI
jgi:hypothetical protein